MSLNLPPSAVSLDPIAAVALKLEVDLSEELFSLKVLWCPISLCPLL